MLSSAVSNGPDRSSGEAGNASAEAELRGEVVKAACTLEELSRHREFLGHDVTQAIADTVVDVRRRLERQELAVVVVGEKKAGKSTFLNAILGARVLGTAVRECTGTVTFIRRAERPTYRATLRDNTVIEFQEVEAVERAEIAAATSALCASVGENHGHAMVVVEGDVAALMAGVQAEHHVASQRRGAAEHAVHEAEARLGQVAEEAHRRSGEREAAAARVAQGVQQLAATRTQLAATEATLRAATSRLRQYGPTRALQLPVPIDTARQALQSAEDRLSSVSASVPFFLRPAPWFMFWVFLLRWMFGAFFRDQLKALAAAQEARAGARLLISASEASARVDSGRELEQRGVVQLERARSDLTAAGDIVRAAEERRAAAEAHTQALRSMLVVARRTEDLLQLRLLHLRSTELEKLMLARFRTEVHNLTDMEKRGDEVVELSIGFPAAYLPDGIAIIDTPGVNTDNAVNRERAWDVIRREADGCLLVSDLQQVVSRSTREFLQEVRPIIPHILLVMSKMDKALANAEDVGNVDPTEQVEEARRTGVRRFAREVGRASDEVFSIAVAAERALKGDAPNGLGHGFHAEVAKVFDLLQSERAIVLGARAAAAIRYCVQRIAEAQTQAEQKYNQRIALLEAHRLPDPRDFQARQLAKIEDALRAQSEAIAKRARDAMLEGIDDVQEQWTDAIDACSSKDEVKAAVARLGQEGQHAIATVMSRVARSVATWSGEVTKALEAPLLEGLRERYRIIQKMPGSGLAVHVGEVGAARTATHAINLHAGVAGAVANFEGEQFAIGAGGALAGAAIGTMVLPGIGTAVGAALGALAGLFKTLDSLKSDCIKEVERGLGEAKHHLGGQLATLGPDVYRATRDALARGLTDAVTRFQSWISQVMTAERMQIEQERQKLSHLIQSRDALIRHDQSLATLQRAAAAVSRGLCA